MSSIINANSKIIWNFLASYGFSECGVAGLMGNLYAESGLNPINLENTGNAELGMTDEYYTSCVDNCTYSNFITDGCGYGLAQWTWHTRKRYLYEFVKSFGLSIGDLTGQLKYLVVELKNHYPTVYNTLVTTNSIKEASNIVLTEFECPADMSDKVKNLRASYAQEYYNAYATKEPIPENKYITYTVQDGDTLWGIAAAYKISVNDLLVVNNASITNPDVIEPGQVLNIPTFTNVAIPNVQNNVVNNVVDTKVENNVIDTTVNTTITTDSNITFPSSAYKPTTNSRGNRKYSKVENVVSYTPNKKNTFVSNFMNKLKNLFDGKKN